MGAIRELTARAQEMNTSHLDSCAMELNQLSDGYNLMNNMLMPDSEKLAGIMDNLYLKESAGGQHPL